MTRPKHTHISSCVGPMPPLVMTRSYFSVIRVAASTISSSMSGMTSILRAAVGGGGVAGEAWTTSGQAGGPSVQRHRIAGVYE